MAEVYILCLQDYNDNIIESQDIFGLDKENTSRENMMVLDTPYKRWRALQFVQKSPHFDDIIILLKDCLHLK